MLQNKCEVAILLINRKPDPIIIWAVDMAVLMYLYMIVLVVRKKNIRNEQEFGSGRLVYGSCK